MTFFIYCTFASNSPRVNAIGDELEEGDKGVEDELEDDNSLESSCARCTLARSSLKVIVIYYSLSIGLVDSEDDSVDEEGSKDNSGVGLIRGSIHNSITDTISIDFGAIQGNEGKAAKTGIRVIGDVELC
jgi:hypothetical protein